VTGDRTATRRRDEGSALIMVLGAMTVVSLFVSVALTNALHGSDTARRATEWNQAFAAAEAGVDDYVARLNQDDNYWRTVDCANGALRGATTRSNGCGWTSATTPGWLGVPGADRAQFHYDVDVSETPVDGTIDVVSTGRVGEVTRSIEVTLRRGGFGEFLYYTDYETQDPADMANPVDDAVACTRYLWGSPARSHTRCGRIDFVTGDRINGPLHSNDTMAVRGTPTFQGTVTTSTPACRPAANGTPPPATRCYFKVDSSTSPKFLKGIAYRSPVDIPDSIGDLRQYVDRTQTTTPGCLYTGPTRIVFNPTVGNATPTMKVWSNWSTVSALNPGCAGTQVGAATWPRTVTVPQNNLIMVQDVPSGQTAPASGKCADGAIGDGYPVAGDYNQLLLNDSNCRYGTVLVEGTLKGRVTISADNDIVITDDLTYQGGQNGTDALGLVAENSVQIYHPISTACTRYKDNDNKKECLAWGPGTTNLKAPDGAYNTNPTVHASILTLQHSFEVQVYDKGPELGTLTLYGSIAQRFRGIVGTGNGATGYLKNYNYDSRLRYAPPPYFLDPVRSAWGQKTFGEVTPRYRG
jgi:hypothetical protein